jgi:hypothetical protein
LRPLLADSPVRYWCWIFLFVLLVCLVDSPGLIDQPGAPWIWFWLPLALAINADKMAVPSAGDAVIGKPQH